MVARGKARTRSEGSVDVVAIILRAQSVRDGGIYVEYISRVIRDVLVVLRLNSDNV